MISDYLANWGCLVHGESYIKIYALKIRTERRSNVNNEDKRIRKEISPRTKTSTQKA